MDDVWRGVVWIAVVGTGFYGDARQSVADAEARQGRCSIIGGGAVVPTLVLAGLLVYGLGMLPRFLARAPEGSLKIAVTGEQWWWRVRYLQLRRQSRPGE